MVSARRNRFRWTYGLLASVALNALLISAVAFQQPILRQIKESDDRVVVRATLVVLPRTSPTPRHGDRTPSPEPLAVHAAPPTAEHKTDVAPSPIAAKATPPPSVPTSTQEDEADVRERVGKALRGLNACTKFDTGPQARQKPPCGKAWAAPGLAIDAVSPELRAQIQAEKSRSDDAVAVGNRFRENLRDHGAQGNNVHFGCSIDTGGKVKCSTY